MFNFFKKKKEDKGIILSSPITGEAVNITEVPDPTFAEKMLGDGVAIIPAEGEVVSPVDGTIGMVFETKHAVSITSTDGAEILIHVGLDTVSLGGNGFEAFVKAGDEVKVGDKLLDVNLDVIKEAGLNTITPVVVCNADEYAAIEAVKLGEIARGDSVVKLTPKN